jgi:uncharacterized membrane protein
MPHDASTPDTEPRSAEWSWVSVAYALQAIGVFGFVLGPLIGLIINYARRDAEGVGFIASHHGWLIRTFWWTLLWYLLCLAVILAGAWPIVSEVVREAIRTGGHAHDFRLGIAWDAIFATVGAAMLGALGIVVVWIWNLYRIVRGGLRLADGRPAP